MFKRFLAMRRNAIKFTLPTLCAMLAVFATEPVGKAAGQMPVRVEVDAKTQAAVEALAPMANVAPTTTVPPVASESRELLQPRPMIRLPRAHMVMMEVTAYCPCKKCCGPRARGVTASGKRVNHNGGKFVAADTSLLPFKTKLIVPGYASNKPVEVIDRGGAIKGRKLDVYFPTHHQAMEWGRKKMEVLIFE